MSGANAAFPAFQVVGLARKPVGVGEWLAVHPAKLVGVTDALAAQPYNASVSLVPEVEHKVHLCLRGDHGKVGADRVEEAISPRIAKIGLDAKVAVY